MDWLNGYEIDKLAERQIDNVPEWAKAEHMEMSSPLSEIWKLSSEISGRFPHVRLIGKGKERNSKDGGRAL